LKFNLRCSKCGVSNEANIYGKDALEFIKKYGTIQNGKLFVYTCPCGGDMLIVEESKVAEL